jgi:CIC family chloride channel protein
VVAYCLFCLVFGWGSLFESPDFTFSNPLELGPYVVLAMVLVIFGVYYVKSFYGLSRFFKYLKIPNHIKPAIGGLCTGIIGFFLPQTLAFGYGFVQQALENKLTIPFLFTLAVGKVLTTSFSIGSGGSGGVFGPSVVIGGAAGGVVGKFFHQVMPGVVTDPGAFVVVGMAGFFAGVSNTPISTIIFVSEMTKSYGLLLPSLLVCTLCYLASQRWTIYDKQVKNRLNSPVHRGDFFVDILETYKVKDLMPLVKKVAMIPQDMLFVDFKKYFSESKQHYFPVMDREGRLRSIFSVNDVRGVLFSPEIERLVVMKDIGTSDIIFTTPEDDLNSVLKKITIKNIDSLPVVNEKDHTNLIGMLNRREVISFYNEQIQKLETRNNRAEEGPEAPPER